MKLPLLNRTLQVYVERVSLLNLKYFAKTPEDINIGENIFHEVLPPPPLILSKKVLDRNWSYFPLSSCLRQLKKIYI